MGLGETIRCARVVIVGLLVVGCTHGPERRVPLERPPTPPGVAQKEFEEVAAAYKQAATGTLSPQQCEAFAADFTHLYKKHGKQMAIAWFNAGAVKERCGDVAGAEKIYRKVIEAAPKFDLAYNNLGVILWNRHEEAEALRYFKSAVHANPRTKAPRNNLAAALRNKYAGARNNDDFTRAETHLQSVLALDSSNRLAFENLARLYYDRGRLEDKSYLLLAELVVTQANRVLAVEDEESADLHNLKGLLLMERGNQVDALRAFKHAVQVEPSHADAHMNLAMISLRYRDFAQAERSIAVALKDKRQRNNVEAYLGLGVARRGLRKFGDAKDAFTRAMKVDKKDSRALYNLGVLHQEHIAPAGKGDGRKDNLIAKKYFTRFVARAGEGAKVKDARARVKSIDEYVAALDEAARLQKAADKAAAAAAKEEKERRERLLKMEREALKAQTSQNPTSNTDPG